MVRKHVKNEDHPPGRIRTFQLSAEFEYAIGRLKLRKTCEIIGEEGHATRR